MKESTVKKLWSVKWNLVIMAAFCFAYAVYIYVTPAAVGEGTFMITPTAGLPGLLKQLPWIFIGLGVLGIISSFASTSGWVLAWTEPVMGLAMFVFGFWELFFPYDISVFSKTYAFIGIFMAFYVMFVSLHMDRIGKGHWFVELCLAAVTWIVSFVNIMNFAGEHATQGLTSLTFFIAAWGFTYGAIILTGEGSLDESIASPVRFFRARKAAKAAKAGNAGKVKAAA